MEPHSLIGRSVTKAFQELAPSCDKFVKLRSQLVANSNGAIVSAKEKLTVMSLDGMYP